MLALASGKKRRGWDIDVDANGDPIATGGKYIAQLASSGFNCNRLCLIS
jgi:hypothetical protein